MKNIVFVKIFTFIMSSEKVLKNNKKNKKLSRCNCKTEGGVLQKWSAAYCDFDHENLGFAVIFFFSDTIFSPTLDEKSRKVSFLLKHGRHFRPPTFLFWFIYTMYLNP